MFEAIAIVWKAMGWHPQDDDFATRKQQEKSVVPVPEIQMEWDEASCGQLVWLYNEAISRFGGQTKPSSPPSPARSGLSRARSRDARCALRPWISAAAQRIWRSPIINWMMAPAITSKSPRSCCSVKGLRWRVTTRCWM
jgi:hypothetical protein